MIRQTAQLFSGPPTALVVTDKTSNAGPALQGYEPNLMGTYMVAMEFVRRRGRI